MNRLRHPIAFVRSYLGDEPIKPILTLFLLNAVDEFDIAAFQLLGPEISDQFGIDIGVFGTIALVATLVIPFVSLPVSLLADRSKRLPIALAGAVLWGTASFGTGLATTLGVLIVFRLGSAFGKVVNDPVHGALIADYYSPAARVKAYGIHWLANPVGQVIASVSAGLMAEAWGYQWPFLVLAIPTFLALLFGFRLSEPSRGNHEVVETPTAPPIPETFRRLWAIRALRYQWIGLAFTTGSTLGIGIIVPFYLDDEFGVGPGLRGILMGVGTALASAAVLFGVAFVQRKLDQSPSTALRFLSHAGVVAGIVMFVMAFAPSLWLAVGCIWTVLVIFGFVTPGLRAMGATVAPPEIRATAFAMASVVALGGAGFAILGFALGEAGNVRWALAVLAPVFLRGVGYFYKAATYMDDDVDRLRPPEERRSPTGPVATGQALLEVRNLCVSYGGVRVLFGIDLDVGAGEVVALLGTNGSGKSTTLNAISGVVEPDRGNVWLDGEPLTGMAPDRIVRKGIVQAPGGKGIFPGLTVAENLQMGAFLLGRDTATAASRIGEVCELFPRLGERLTQRAGDLSGGERQMLTLGQSFLLRPSLLMIDELSLGLAPTIIQELLAAVRTMNAEGISMLVVEQSVNVALTLAGRAYFLEKGEVRFSGPTPDLLDRPDLLRSVFLEGAGAAVRRKATP
ncbi:MAG TPA: ATP-binding protein [Nitriliruptorales bacterium]